MQTFRVTAKRDIGGKIAKGLSVQVVETGGCSFPQLPNVMAAFKQQFGIEVKTVVSMSYFDVEKI